MIGVIELNFSCLGKLSSDVNFEHEDNQVKEIPLKKKLKCRKWSGLFAQITLP